MVRLAVVVLTWNGRTCAPACLRAVLPQLGGDDLLVVVDNGSADDTGALVRRELDTAPAGERARPRTELLVQVRNLGFAGGMNVGIAWALQHGAEYVLLLNQDTVADDGAVARLLEAAARHPLAASFQPLLLRPNGTTIDSAGQVLSRLPGAHDLLAGMPRARAPAHECAIFGPCGAAALIRAAALHAAGPLDAEHFLIFEDTDLAFRLRYRAGPCLLVPRAVVAHTRGVSARQRRPDAQRRFLALRNGLALALRHWPGRWLLLAAPVLLLRVLLALHWQRAAGHAAWPLWRRALRERRTLRAAAVRAGTDRWIGRATMPLDRDGSSTPAPSVRT